MVRELVRIAGAGSIILLLRAGLAGRVEELHELSETVGNLGGEAKVCSLFLSNILTLSIIYQVNLISSTQ